MSGRMRWLLAGTGVIGAALNAGQIRASFLLWIVANIGWIIVNVRRREWPETALFSVYLVTAVAGWFGWGPSV